MSGVPVPTLPRLLAKTENDHNGCLVFTGHVRPSGYATIQHNGRKQLVHRVAHELFIGPIPPGMQVDHLCRNRACLNPAHLEAVTPHENNRRSTSRSAIQATWTHCLHGHVFDEKNTRLDRRGRRHCRACDARRHRIARKARP